MDNQTINKFQNMIIPSHLKTANTLIRSRTDSMNYTWEKDGIEVI